MLRGRITQSIVRLLDRIVSKSASEDDSPAHLRTGRRGEEDAYFYLRRRGYVMVARNFRSSHHHGEIDLIGWDRDVLCFIEVKTRTTHDVKTAEAAVDRRKRRHLRAMIRDYLRSLPMRQFPGLPRWRFDILTVHYEEPATNARKEVFRNRVERTAGLPAASECECAAPGQKRTHGRITPVFELFQNAALSS